MTPRGVQGASRAVPSCSRPTLSGAKPSASLAGIDGLQHGAGGDVRRQRELDEDGVHVRVRVECRQRGQQIGLGWCRAGRRMVRASQARLPRGAVLVADIDGAGRVLADQDDGQAGLVGQRGDVGGEGGAQRGGQRPAVQEAGGQGKVRSERMCHPPATPPSEIESRQSMERGLWGGWHIPPSSFPSRISR